MPDASIYLKDYKAPVFTVDSVYLNFDLYDDHVLVESLLTLSRQHPGDLCLYGEDLELVSICMDGLVLDASAYTVDKESLVIPNAPDALTLTLVTKIEPQKNTQLSGLYRTHRLFCTQCEAEGFRRITYFPDRPDVLTVYKVRITADKASYPYLLSNGNLLESGDLEDGRHWVVWQDPFKKPSYLFALVAGDLACITDHFITVSGKKVALHLFVEPGNEDKCAHAMESLKKAMCWDEVIYGREYDLDVFMIVAVSDFNMGAMENKGLNVFNSKYILARPDTATDKDFADIEGVVAHEYFHNWTGNRVTCRDWFQLSLKEGLTVFRDQEFSRDMNSREVNRIMDVKALRTQQFPEDAGSLAHPVRPESYQEINNFYTATIYNKGAEVIRMQHTLLGKRTFRKGMDLYFQRYDGQAVTIDDFVSSMQDASGKDLTQFKRWYSQAGTPTLTIQTHYEGGEFTIVIKQSCPSTPECSKKLPFHIPIGIAMFDSKGEMIPLDNPVLELTESEQHFVYSGLREKPVLSLLRGFSAPVYVKDSLTEEDLLFLLRNETDGYAMWDAAQRVMLNCINRGLKVWPQSCAIPESLLIAFKEVLQDETLDPSLRAEIITPPSFEEVIGGLELVDVALVEAVRDSFHKQLGLGLKEEVQGIYQKLWQQETHAMNGEAYGQRALRNACLWFLMMADETGSLDLCWQQFVSAQTMTDQIASFSLLVKGSDTPFRTQAIERFYNQWSKEGLVLDKWFALQAVSDRVAVLKEVRGLLQHPAFNMKNPNKVRALVGGFCMANPRHFHALDGSGYAFLSEMIVLIDALNPQIAARLATPFTRWKRFDAPRQALMKAQLEALAKGALSKDLRELVDKSL